MVGDGGRCVRTFRHALSLRMTVFILARVSVLAFLRRQSFRRVSRQPRREGERRNVREGR